MVVNKQFEADLVSSPLKSDKKHSLKQRFDVQRKLGQGTYGKVQLAINRETGQEVAVKTIKKVKIENERDLVRIRREIQIMSSIQHPHIIHIYEVFENKDKIVLVMQFASGGELYDFLSQKKVLSDLEARRIFRQIAAAVYYCHINKICHRDLKLENILLDEKGNAKIADFGLSNVYDQTNFLNTYCGSPLYAAPEIVKGVPYYGPDVDCWSMGVLLYTLCYGAMPFDGSNFKKLVTQISEGDYFEPKKKSSASDLIRKLLTVDPEKRANIVDICLDEWVNIGYEHSLLQIAEEMANLTPVRLDLLLALAPEAATVPKEEAEDSVDVVPEKETTDEDEEEDEYDGDTAANSFAFTKGSRASKLSISSPNLVADEYEEGDSETEFLPADIAAALQGTCAKRLAEASLGDSLARISSLVHQSKKPKRSESSMGKEKEPENGNKVNKGNENISKDKSKENVEPKSQAATLEKSSKTTPPHVSGQTAAELKVNESTHVPQCPTNDLNKVSTGSTKVKSKDSSVVNQNVKNSSSKITDEVAKNESMTGCPDSSIIEQRKESLSNQEDKADKKGGRPPGKIVIPKTFDSPCTSPSPKPSAAVKKSITGTSKTDSENSLKEPSSPFENNAAVESPKPNLSPKTSNEDVNKNIVQETKTNNITEDQKCQAKSILKKGIAKAKLAERKLSKQDSQDSEVSSSCSTPISTAGVLGQKPSFYKSPKPYAKNENVNVTSKAEIKLSSSLSSTSTVKNDATESVKAPLWDSQPRNTQLPDKNKNWSIVSSTIDSEIGSWKEQMEESLKRLSPEDERSSHKSYTVCKEDDKPMVPIARSYKKFTFTKDGACITETKKIYTAPGADGSWTKVEKKTKITTRPGNVEEFEKFRDLHLRADTQSLARSDSQSSSNSNEVYDDIFDSWTGDTMACNMRRMNSVFQKFSRDPFLRRERRKNPFRLFRRTESEKNDREKRVYEIGSGKEPPDNDEEYDVHYDDTNAVVYGSQGLWQLLRSTSRGLPGSITIHHEPVLHGRSVSQDRSNPKDDEKWKRSGSRISSGYNTGTRSQSRDRTESPREKVLRFVFESPQHGFTKEVSAHSSPTKHEKWSLKRNLSRHHPRRDSGVGSDGYESEYSVRHSTSDELTKVGRVPSVSSICSEAKQDIRNFMKSWSKEFVSPSGSPPFGSDQLGSLPEGRKQRVERWLHMNSDSPFESGIGSRRTTAASPSFATMRPREYMQYHRSSSDKMAEYSDFFPSFDESYRRSHSREFTAADPGRVRIRTSSAYSPVSEESLKDIHSRHRSESSGSPVHHINFTISDGRVSSPPLTTRYVRQVSGSPEACFTVESPQIRSQPVVQMRVSFNRNAPNNPIQSSKGLWGQQEQAVPREPSPVPGIRQFSTEVQHCVGKPEQSPQVSVKCEVTTPHGNQSGKKSPYSMHLPLESSIWNTACVSKGMDQCELANTNNKCDSKHNSKESPMHPNLNHVHDIDNSSGTLSQSNGANTPDSLEDVCVNNNNEAPNENLDVDVKPLGTLWNNCTESKVNGCGKYTTFAQIQNSSPTNTSESGKVDLQEKCLEKMTSEFGSIWKQKNAAETFDLLKNLLSDDGFESFSSAKRVLNSSNNTENGDFIIDDNAPVIDNADLGAKYSKLMPSLMDDLQSPKEVLRQAMQICDSMQK